MKHSDKGPVSIGSAWAYLVVSSDHQAETLPYQKQWATRTAFERGWEITNTFQASSSGRDGIRELLETLIAKLIETPRIERPERVLMTRLDRLGRGDPFAQAAAFAQIRSLGVKVFTREDGDYSVARASDAILPMMRMLTAAIENEARIDKAISVYDRKRRAGLVTCNKRPYGLRLEAGRDVPDDERADVVRKAFELASNGYGLYAIGVRLAAIAPPRVYRNGRQHVIDWTADRVRKLLTTASYRATLIDEETWVRVESIRNAASIERGATKNPWPLAGALTCDCGRRLIGSLRGSNKYRVYRCRARPAHGRTVTHSALRLEAAFKTLVHVLDASPGLIAQDASNRTDLIQEAKMLGASITRARATLPNCQKERERVWDLNTSGKLRDEDLQARLDGIQTRESEAKKEIASFEQQRNALRLLEHDRENAEQVIERADRLWALATVDDQKIIAKAVARAFGGLTVTVDGLLRLGGPAERTMFFKEAPKDSATAEDLEYLP